MAFAILAPSRSSWTLLNATALHLAPPCGTSSRARELPNGPPPLRSLEFPDGLPSLSGLDALRVSKIGHRFATASETAYPPLMCALIAQAFYKELLHAGVLPASDNLHESAPSLARAASVAVGKQPKGKSLLPLMPEYACVVKVTCAPSALPTGPVLQAEWSVLSGATCVPLLRYYLPNPVCSVPILFLGVRLMGPSPRFPLVPNG